MSSTEFNECQKVMVSLTLTMILTQFFNQNEYKIEKKGFYHGTI